MILTGCLPASGRRVDFTPRPFNSPCNSPAVTYFSRNPTSISYAKANIVCHASLKFDHFSSTGGLNTNISHLYGDHGTKLAKRVQAFPRHPTLPSRNLATMVTRASKDVPYSFRFPPMTKKPRWWWRVLACVPYLLPLHEPWMYAETAYHLHPFLESYEFLTYPFLQAVGRLPRWALLAYFFTLYLGIVRRKEWPHFLRFHVVMGMLLEIALQVVGTMSRWSPRAAYYGLVGRQLWVFLFFAFLFTVLECLRCALTGKYADVPFFSDAAYIQIPYE